MTRVEDARDSGLAWLTGRADGSALIPPGRAASTARELGAALGLSDGAGLLGERAAFSRRGRAAPWSVGGACRAVRCADGWLALSLARAWDLDAVPALVSREDVGDPWEAIHHWAGVTPAAEAAARGALLGLACGIVGEPISRPPVVATRLAPPGELPAAPLVVCLASLWAGPLCASLLRGLGAQVIFVQSAGRPDAMAEGDPLLFSLLHGDSPTFQRNPPHDLMELLRSADIVIEGARPRVLEQWGISISDVLSRSATTWVSITGHGRDQGHRVGLGDDAAMTGGLVVWSADGVPWPVGDAVADPLAGLHAGVAAWSAAQSGGGLLLDVSLSACAADATGHEPAIEAIDARRPRARS